jgi:hypothetical protein
MESEFNIRFLLELYNVNLTSQIHLNVAWTCRRCVSVLLFGGF